MMSGWFSDAASAWSAVVLTVQLASVTTALLLGVATPLAWWLSQTSSRWRAPILAFVTLPLVLPPTVLGFYLLVAMGPQGWLGQWTQAMGWGLLSFTFSGLVLGSMVFSLPFAVQPLQHSFEAMGRRTTPGCFFHRCFAPGSARHGHCRHLDLRPHRG